MAGNPSHHLYQNPQTHPLNPTPPFHNHPAPPPPPYHEPPAPQTYFGYPQPLQYPPVNHHQAPPNYFSLPPPSYFSLPPPSYFSRLPPPPPPQNHLQYLKNRFFMQEEMEKQRRLQLIRDHGKAPEDVKVPSPEKQKTEDPPSEYTRMCNRTKDNRKCKNDECKFAHNEDELQPHPLLETEPCRNLRKGVECPFGNKCDFRHDLSDEEFLR